MEENAKICNVKKKENMVQYGIIIHAHITPDEPRSYPLSGKSYNDFGFLHLVPLSPEESFWRRFGAAPLASIFPQPSFGFFSFDATSPTPAARRPGQSVPSSSRLLPSSSLLCSSTGKLSTRSFRVTFLCSSPKQKSAHVRHEF